MNLEELKVIMETLSQMGDKAQSAFVWYLIINYLPAYLIGIGWTTIGGYILFKLTKILNDFIVSQSTLYKIAKAAKNSFPMGQWSNYEIEKVCRILEENI